MNRMSLNRKLWLALALVWVGLLGVGAWSAFETRTTMLAERKEGMANLVDSAAGVVKAYYALAQSGKMSDEDARRDALERLAAMRYGDSGYLFVMDSKPVVLMHPTLPKLVGTQVGDYLDPDGKRLFVTILNAAKAGGHGFAEYRGRLPHSETAVPKISYVTRFAPWDWNISSGVFLKDIDTVYYETLVGHLAVVFVIGLVITAAMLVIIRNVRASLGGEPDEAASLAARIAAGDLTRPVAVRAGDGTSMMAAMRDMQGRLRSTIGGIRRAAESIAAASHEIASGNHDLSQRTEQQAASLEETAASMEELTATVKQNAENARQASGLANNASEIARKGNDVVSRVIGTMGEINDSSRKIADIIGVIDGIAFQTNILALNAAVEAARAGEQGRGFAVVAGEVRSLAQRSATAAKEIKQLIDASVERVNNGSALVGQAGETMTEILQAVRRVTDIMGEIAAASEEQSSGISQVGRAVTQMDEMTQQNAALVEEAAAAASSLQEQAARLRESVSAFQVGDGAAAGAGAAAGVVGGPNAAASSGRVEPALA
ncbi:methyl-accepting chemotaxis (MCP) signaling domain protein [Burkholderia pseudomallei]|uniref:methyl-accepting chemotaxis protein n=1 Tax=Burkholderia pseudomallei TaxID=28450 RepID=UPI00050FBBA3|nr:methyl-accepting chemotaxis protein [Burkholderia pseudomallei]KGC79879.1 methyl-accepting chemotaxis (MCP) signaling domain protein [Burkholderia pseudomallei]KGS07363.1 methyl-accepting chemotaxis (MCP) signaling domain protein [Burkholderia pseudomallei MSHR7504]KGU71490.1 methyl-accepting chemotaxis (MCP) signaling domain protein [Burkholderia pseudomallei MSHR4304]KGV11671.1 methyl-accepting chemotaxis (MCP) signaling domain protein [Burkholderia pseudomallei TSV 43]KGV30493.1 methyl-a